jgi:tRNA pseudouridine38-40 synthase
MNEAASLLLNYNDFSSFSKSNTQTKTNNCKITAAYWEKNQDALIFKITADRFLRNMVRAIVGTLLEVGFHKITIEEFVKIIESKNRSEAGYSVPAKALFLTKIDYPLHLFEI